MAHLPDFWSNLKAELAGGHQWRDRVVVLAYAVATGLTVVGFTMLAEAASEFFFHLRALDPWDAKNVPFGMSLGVGLTLFWTPILTFALVWWCRKYAPFAAGSGIPQVMAALQEDLPADKQSRWVSVRMSMHKIALVSGGLLAGLSIGREGPTVQVGAGIMLHARRWLSPQSGIDGYDLMVAGAAAGIAAAFNTPLGGIVFALEALSRRRGISHSSLVISAIVLAGLVAISAFGNLSYFGRLQVQSLSLNLLWPGLLVVVLAGLGGGLFSRLIVASAQGMPDRFCRWRTAHPLRFAAACGAGVAVIGAVTGGATAGAGYEPTRALLEGHADLPIVYTLLKFIATWLSAWSGVPGGMFATSLAIGASLGNDVALLTGLSAQDAIPLIALGMVGFLAAATQEPITAFIIVMEMVAGQTMVLSLMATALLASGISRMLTRPMYGELMLLMLPPKPAGSAATGS
ncbi:chloride channel protein [Piscinibacter sakaiensis]|uniref:chloride channel protein n=1 Tax=Piscinibacter sakaiensis TaxID=1547922 RepID=UPI003AAA3191